MTKTQTLNLTVIIGSVREGRFGPVAADWFRNQAEQHGSFRVNVIDLADIPLPPELPPVPPALEPDPQRPAGMAPLTQGLAEADAIVVVTPEYNRSFPASLKQAIDWHFTQWQRRPIGFVGYSGGTGALLAMEQLRQVFGELQAHTVREYVSFPRYYEHFTETGGWEAPEYAAGDAKVMLDELGWWADALREARAVG